MPKPRRNITNIHSIHFRLILWYTGLITCVCLVFGSYAYNGLHRHLDASMEYMMKRRISVLGEGMLAFMDSKGIDHIRSNIKTILAPEANNRFIRITDETGTVIYHSGAPSDHSFDPLTIPLIAASPSLEKHEYPLPNDDRIIVMSAPYQTPQGKKFMIESGQTTHNTYITLHALLLSFALGLPVILVLAATSGYFLIMTALKPIENIRQALENISLSNLKKRLPVTVTGDCIERLSVTLNNMINRFDKSYQQTSRFSADASHELRTPLTIMRGELESIIMEPALTTDLRERIGSVLEETTRLAQITEGLFAISRLDAGEARMKQECVDLTSLVKLTLDQMQLLADERSITVHCPTKRPYHVAGDPSRLKQIIVNLLDNAIKYTPEGGKISLQVRSTHTKVIVEVSDNGIGISPKDMLHIFERFYRADKVRSRDLGGAGLGLSIVRSICIAHNGDIRVENVEPQGTRFLVELPIFSKTSLDSSTT